MRMSKIRWFANVWTKKSAGGLQMCADIMYVFCAILFYEGVFLNSTAIVFISVYVILSCEDVYISQVS